MISGWSSDERKGISSRYGVGGGKMELETELEEGEACFQNSNDDDPSIDPDISLSYIDEKIQDVLGHCQKDFEGGVSAENLGAKFGGYGSFLPSYQRSPVWPRPKTPPKVLTNSAPISPINAHIEVGHQNSDSQACALQAARHGPASSAAGSVPAPRGPSMNGKLKQEVPTLSATCGSKFTSNGQQHVNNLANNSDQKSLKVRIKVCSDNVPTRRNAEIYSGLGLDVSPSSSMEASPVNSDGFFHVPQDGPNESPTSILEIMTSFPVCGSRLVSPLPNDVLHLIDNESWEDGSHGPVHKESQESTVTVFHGSGPHNFDRNILGEKKLKSSEKNSVSAESTNGSDVRNGIGIQAMKGTGMDDVACEELVSNSWRLPVPSNTQSNFGKDAAFSCEPNDDLSDIAKEEPLDPVLTQDDRPNRNHGPVGKIWEAKTINSDEKNSPFPTKADSDVSDGSKTLDTGLVNPPKQKGALKATSHDKDRMKLDPRKETSSTSSSGDKKKPKGSQVLQNGSQNVDISKGGLKKDSSSTSRSKNSAYCSKSYMEDLKKNNGKAREAYEDFFGELDLEQEDDDDIALEKPSGYRLKDSVVTEKGQLENNSSSKERLIGKRSGKPSSSVYARVGSHAVPTMGNGPVSDAAAATVAPVVNEDWVCCDKCEKWRLLPPGVNPGSLPEKWICSMLDWLPGMNRCSISEEETTRAITSRFPGPPIVQGSQPVHPGGPQLEEISIDALLADQRHQRFGSQAPSAGVKKKHGSKDLPNETKQDRHSLSSNSAKKNRQTLYGSRSLNGANQSPVNEVEFQDSGQSNDMIAQKQHRIKRKANNKPCENFVDEGNNTDQSKIGYKRETISDYPRDCKKIKTGGNNGTDEDRVSDHGGAIFKASCSSSSGLPAGVSRKDHWKHSRRPKDTKSTSKVSARNPESQNQISPNDRTFQAGKSDLRDVAKKRKADKFEVTVTHVEEMSETGHGKAKKARVLKSREEGIHASKGIGGADKRGKNVKEEQVRGLDVLDSSRREAVPVHSSFAATSSSSKVSGSHKTKANNQEAKGSPVESVSSSPVRISNPDKFTSSRRNITGVDDCQDASSPKKCSDGDDDGGSHRSGKVEKDDAQIATHLHSMDVVESQEMNLGHFPGNKGKEQIGTSGQGIQYYRGAETSSQGHNKETINRNQSHANGSRRRKHGKESSLRSKDKSQISESLNKNADNPPCEEISKGGKNKSQRKPQVDSDRFENGSALKELPLSEIAKTDGPSKPRRPGGSDARIDAESSQDMKQPSKRDVSDRGNLHSLPPSGRGQNETERLSQPIPGYQKEKAGHSVSLDAARGNDASKASRQNKKSQNQNANQPMNMKHPTPNKHKGRDQDAPSPLRRDISNQATTNALREATTLKHMADRVKNSGSVLESRALYIQAALKFLHVASLFESCHNQSGRYGDMIQSMSIYGSTAKLCEYCAHEYEKTKEMATAALAYKCMEVAYLKVVYSSHTSACKDLNELQTSLQIGPTGESPSSSASASDLDNLNNTATVDKTALAKGVHSPQVAGNHIIVARNRPNFVRILNFAQDVNSAMEASRKSRIAFAAAGSKEDVGLSAVKTALDFNFHDVEELLRLVRVAMENRSSV